MKKRAMKKRLAICVTTVCAVALFITGCGSKNAEVNDKKSKEVSSVSKSMDKKTMGEKSSESGMGSNSKKDSKMGSMSGMMSKSNITVSEGEGYPVTVTDKMGNEVTFDKKPENVAVLSATYLNLFYDCGGTSICTANLDSSSRIPDESIKNLPQVGAVYNVDVEKLLSLKPELVIAQFGLQNGIVPAVQQSNIPVLSFHMKTYDDVIAHIKAFGRIVDDVDKANKMVEKMEADKNKIVEKLPKESKSVVILYVDSKDTSVKLSNSIAGNVCDILKLNNIANGLKAEGMGGENTPLSLEYIIEKDPDVILVTSMLQDEKDAEKLISERLGNDPIYKNLRAVKEGQIVYLPQSHFLYNSGTDFVSGIEYVAKEVYPEIYK